MSASSLPFNYKPIFLAGAPVNPTARIVIRDADLRRFSRESCAAGRYQVEGAMAFYLAAGPENLPRRCFRLEKAFNVEGSEVRIESFNGYETRLFGFATKVTAQPTFFATSLDLGTDTKKARGEFVEHARAEAFKILRALV